MLLVIASYYTLLQIARPLIVSTVGSVHVVDSDLTAVSYCWLFRPVRLFSTGSVHAPMVIFPLGYIPSGCHYLTAKKLANDISLGL